MTAALLLPLRTIADRRRLFTAVVRSTELPTRVRCFSSSGRRQREQSHNYSSEFSRSIIVPKNSPIVCPPSFINSLPEAYRAPDRMSQTCWQLCRTLESGNGASQPKRFFSSPQVWFTCSSLAVLFSGKLWPRFTAVTQLQLSSIKQCPRLWQSSTRYRANGRLRRKGSVAKKECLS